MTNVTETLFRGRGGVRDLIINTAVVTPSTTNMLVLHLFNTNRHLTVIPVVENCRPFGLINRHIFLSQMSRPFYKELYGKKSCIAFMDKSPLIVNVDMSLAEVAEQSVIAGNKSFNDGFIITENELYVGMGLGIDLISAVSRGHQYQHQQIMKSIEYASILQRSMLNTSNQAMSLTLTDWCLTWEPRDCVGGDYYFFRDYSDGWFAAVADCTGHGVPGAFMTLILSAGLSQSLTSISPTQPALLLQSINKYIKDALGQYRIPGCYTASDDGCDIILMFCNVKQNTLTVSGTHMVALLLQSKTGQLISYPADRMGVGYTGTPYNYKWSEHEWQLHEGDLLFVATDGLTEQIGGDRQLMFGNIRLQRFLHKHQHLPMRTIAHSLLSEHKIYQGEQLRRDDFTFWGFRY